MKIFKPHPYQQHALEHILNTPGAGLFLDMGLGKTVITLTALNHLIFDSFEARKILIIAPKRVAQNTWTDEAKKWAHLSNLKLTVCVGSERDRLNLLKYESDIYLINRECVPWLVSLYGAKFPFDTLVIDELSSFKSAEAIRFKALKSVRPLIKRVIGLTGTPAPNSYVDLWSQLYLLDGGVRLGKTVTGFRKTFCYPEKQNGHVVYKYGMSAERQQEINSLIGDICISMSAEDYLQLPGRTDTNVNVQLSEKEQAEYNKFEREAVAELADVEITAANAAALSGKLRQFANGAIYDEKKNWHKIHDAKIDALEELLEKANGKPVIVFYSFKHDLERIKARFGYTRTLDTDEDLKAWNNGKIKLLALHPASAGHGLNMQDGGNIIIWFGLSWSSELYKQANARLLRQGQKNIVQFYYLLTTGTIDSDIQEALERKNLGENALLNAVKARVKNILQKIW